MSQFAGIEVTSEVLSAACSGDTRAQEAIYRSYQRPVYSLIRRLIARPAIADELFQDTFIEILRSLQSYSGDGAFGGWVRAIAVNKCLMYLRSPWHRSFAYLDADENEPLAELLMDGASGPDAQVQASSDVERALATLPPLTRSVVWLHDVEGYTHGEIARLMGRSLRERISACVSCSTRNPSPCHARIYRPFAELARRPARRRCDGGARGAVSALCG